MEERTWANKADVLKTVSLCSSIELQYDLICFMGMACQLLRQELDNN